MGKKVHPRGWRCRVAGTVGAAAFGAVWLFSMLWSIHYHSGGGTQIAITVGGAYVVLNCPTEVARSGGWRLSISPNRLRAGFSWLPESRVNPGHSLAPLGGVDRHVFVPLWLPAAGFGLLGVLGLWRGRRRGGPGQCRACGYDLAGLGPGAVCPECGWGQGAPVSATRSA